MKKTIIDTRDCPLVDLKENDYLVETAGFVPLSVRFKQFTENGIMSRLRAEQYDTDLPISELEKPRSKTIIQFNFFHVLLRKLFL